ncbi:hypothetical protein Taro_042723 [Colocasia esculenta]|uniref:Uncharacterized protein n=1 Tax=Colocasia esculenta TaxID=4460 RepID=A0A843WX79_COLES|nr:hypothetical protein [Colocasia esculenta]
MWTFRRAVPIDDKGVDANLRMVQVIGSPEGSSLSSHSFPLAPTCRPGTEEWLDDRRMRGVAKLREETSRRGAIPVGARGGLGVNRGITGDSNVRARRTSLVRRPVPGRVVAVQGQHLQQSSSSSVVL